jgi:hypothetical protein
VWRWQDRSAPGLVVKAEFLADLDDVPNQTTVTFDGCDHLGAVNLRGTGFATRDWQLHPLVAPGPAGDIHVELRVAGLAGYLLAKTHVAAIHLYDSDHSRVHNAFRAPGAISLEQLKKSPYKVDYFASVYGQMHRGIVSHPYFIDGSTVSELAGVEFAFLAMDAGPGKAAAIDALDMSPTPFVDVGMGLYEVDSAIAGQLRVVTSLPAQRSRARRRIPIENVDAANEYGRNIQIADLNALNAALAVIRWKKLFGFYLDLEHEQFTAYQTNGNCLINEDF